MRRFVLRQNIERFERLLAAEQEESERRKLKHWIAEAQVELDEIERWSAPDLLRGNAALISVANRAIDDVMRVAGAHFGYIQLVDPATGKLFILAQKNLPLLFLVHFAAVPAGDGSACARCLAAKAPVAVPDVAEDAAYAPHRAIAIVTGYRAAYSAPLQTAAGDPFGAMSILFRDPQAFEHERELKIGQQAHVTAVQLLAHLPA